MVPFEEGFKMKKHLFPSNKYDIEKYLSKRLSFKEIGKNHYITPLI